MTDFVVSRATNGHNSGSKAPKDVRSILVGQGLKPIDLGDNRRLRTRLGGTGKILRAGAAPAAGTICVQYPGGALSASLRPVLKRASTVAFVHDLESLRRDRDPQEDIRRLLTFDALIVHSTSMTDWVTSHLPDARCVTLDLFDYLLAGPSPLRPATRLPSSIYFVGNLDPAKAAFLYAPGADLPHITAFGNNFAGSLASPKIEWRGMLDADSPQVARDGFGLVWDGLDPHGLDGPLGRYLRYNSPHKASFYIAAGLPLVVSIESALCRFVRDRGVGLCVSSLADIKSAVAAVTPTAWHAMCEAVAHLRIQCLRGDFTRRAWRSASLEVGSGSQP